MTFPVLSAGTSAYNLTNSLRFRASASAYLNRTPASATNRTTWTWSAWIKRGNIGSQNAIFQAGTIGTNDTGWYFRTDSAIDFYTRTGSSIDGYITTAAVFRDPSAWYHFVFVYDSTNATAANRMQIYCNGVLQTVTINNTLPQNTNSFVNSNVAHYLGELSNGSAFFDGYMDEVNFIDGQALTPSSFGSTNAVTGVWQPAKYTGTYGTNGFYLPFTNTTSTTTLGNDFSGNGNNWTTNNISLTPGATYDSMTDVPTLTSPTAANFAVLNPLQTQGYANLGFSNGNLTASNTSAGGSAYFITIIPISGSYYFEATATTVTGNFFAVWAHNKGYYSNGTSDGSTAFGATYTSGDVIGVSFNMSTNVVTFYKNNVSQGTQTGSAASVFFSITNSGDRWDVNFGQRPFAYTPPSGFLPLNTFNLPTPSIVDAGKHFDVALVTGSSSVAQVITVKFAPDFLWSKCRNNAVMHGLYDTVRGGNKYLSSNATDAETTTTGNIVTFNSNGATLQAGGSVINDAGRNYVDWLWKAGGAGVTNTAGSITSTVSANTTSGFSVVKWNGTGNATIGHGLGVAPSMYIVKLLDQTSQWYVYFRTLGAGSYVQLNLTAGAVTDLVIWQNTAPTSTVFSIGSGINANNMIAYCFAPIAGFSAFGSYTGNGSTDGPFIYTGFRPRWVMFKRTNSTGNWVIFDTARGTYNQTANGLFPDLSDAEDPSSIFDLLSNGFKARSSGSAYNINGGTYIYAAFAENPFKNALAR